MYLISLKPHDLVIEKLKKTITSLSRDHVFGENAFSEIEQSKYKLIGCLEFISIPP